MIRHKRMNRLKKNLHSKERADTLARLDGPDWFDEIR